MRITTVRLKLSQAENEDLAVKSDIEFDGKLIFCHYFHRTS